MSPGPGGRGFFVRTAVLLCRHMLHSNHLMVSWSLRRTPVRLGRHRVGLGGVPAQPGPPDGRMQDLYRIALQLEPYDTLRQHPNGCRDRVRSEKLRTEAELELCLGFVEPGDQVSIRRMPEGWLVEILRPLDKAEPAGDNGPNET